MSIRKTLALLAANTPYSIAQLIATAYGIGIVNASEVELLVPDSPNVINQKIVLNMQTRDGKAHATATIGWALTASGMAGSPISGTISAVLNDTDEVLAGKLAAALIANVTINAFFYVTQVGTRVFLESKANAADDNTMALVVTNTTGSNVYNSSTGAFTGITSTLVQAGATVGNTASVTVGDADMKTFGDGQVIQPSGTTREASGTTGGNDITQMYVMSATARQNIIVKINQR